MKEGHQQRPIVCGTDFSAMATEAVDVAAGMARRLGTRLVLVHVEEYSGMAAVDQGLFKEALSQKQGDLEKDVTRLRNLGTDLEIKLLSGSVFDELIAAGVACKGRFIVVGAAGHGLARRLLVGSVAERTAETSPLPTLIVRPGGRLGGWLRGEDALKVLVGYDFSPASDAALAWVRDLQQLGRCQIRVLHVRERPDESHQAVERELSERVAKASLTGEVTAAVESTWGSAEGALFEAAQVGAIDMVVVGTHQRQGLSRMRFGSVSRAVLRHATVSVAVIPPPETT